MCSIRLEEITCAIYRERKRGILRKDAALLNEGGGLYVQYVERDVSGRKHTGLLLITSGRINVRAIADHATDTKWLYGLVYGRVQNLTILGEAAW